MVETLCRSAAKGKSVAVQDAAARGGDGEALGRGAATMQPARRLMRAAVRALVGPRATAQHSVRRGHVRGSLPSSDPYQRC